MHCSSSSTPIPAIGRGNDIVCYAINHVANMVVGKKIEDFFADMGKTYDYREQLPRTSSSASDMLITRPGNASSRQRSSAPMDRFGKGSHPPRNRRRRQRDLGPLRQGSRQAPVEAHLRLFPGGIRQECLLPLYHRRHHP